MRSAKRRSVETWARWIWLPSTGWYLSASLYDSRDDVLASVGRMVGYSRENGSAEDVADWERAKCRPVRMLVAVPRGVRTRNDGGRRTSHGARPHDSMTPLRQKKERRK